MPFVESFAPVIGENPKVLILGSMPGIASLEAQQYYAHPRNLFWPILSALFDIDWSADYASRILQVKKLPVVLWDSLKACHREGSLDSAIAKDSIKANDIVSLLEHYPSIRLIAFNGATSEKYFKKTVAKQLAGKYSPDFIRLPSTSPAHASKSFQQKLEDWRVITTYLD